MIDWFIWRFIWFICVSRRIWYGDWPYCLHWILYHHFDWWFELHQIGFAATERWERSGYFGILLWTIPLWYLPHLWLDLILLLMLNSFLMILAIVHAPIHNREVVKRKLYKFGRLLRLVQWLKLLKSSNWYQLPFHLKLYDVRTDFWAPSKLPLHWTRHFVRLPVASQLSYAANAHAVILNIPNALTEAENEKRKKMLSFEYWAANWIVSCRSETLIDLRYCNKLIALERGKIPDCWDINEWNVCTSHVNEFHIYYGERLYSKQKY